MTTEPRTPLLVSCQPCGHVWPAVWLPMEMAKAARLIKAATCPACGGTGKSIFLATKAEADTWTAGKVRP